MLTAKKRPVVLPVASPERTKGWIITAGQVSRAPSELFKDKTCSTTSQGKIEWAGRPASSSRPAGCTSGRSAVWATYGEPASLHRLVPQMDPKPALRLLPRPSTYPGEDLRSRQDTRRFQAPGPSERGRRRGPWPHDADSPRSLRRLQELRLRSRHLAVARSWKPRSGRPAFGPHLFFLLALGRALMGPDRRPGAGAISAVEFGQPAHRRKCPSQAGFSCPAPPCGEMG